MNVSDNDTLVTALIEEGYKAICFFLPTYNVGGGNYYFSELARWISSNHQIEVYYYDFPNGYSSSLLIDSEVRIINYHEGDVIFPIEDKCIVITNSTRVVLLPKMRSDNKLFFWHYETVHCAWNKVLLMNETHSFFEMCQKNAAIAFHDWSGWKSLSDDYLEEFDKRYLPLSIPPYSNIEIRKPIRDDEINITWVGRLANDKYRSLEYIIDCLSRYNTKKKKILHIIGDGLKRDTIIQKCMGVSKTIEIDFAGTVPHEELGRYLLRKTDILFAMGLSAYEGIVLGIPSVFVLIDTKKIEANRFYWLHDTVDYCAGILAEQIPFFDVQSYSFSDIMTQYYTDNYCRKILGEKMKRFVENNCLTMERIVNILLNELINSSLTMKELKECIKYIPYRNIAIKRTSFLGIYNKLKIINKNGCEIDD